MSGAVLFWVGALVVMVLVLAGVLAGLDRRVSALERAQPSLTVGLGGRVEASPRKDVPRS